MGRKSKSLLVAAVTTVLGLIGVNSRLDTFKNQFAVLSSGHHFTVRVSGTPGVAFEGQIYGGASPHPIKGRTPFAVEFDRKAFSAVGVTATKIDPYGQLRVSILKDGMANRTNDTWVKSGSVTTVGI